MKKKLDLIFLSLVIIMAITSLVSAQWYKDKEFFSGASETIIQWIKDIFGPFFQTLLGTGNFDEFFWAKILFLILAYAIFYLSLIKVEMFRNKEGVAALISIIVSIFAVRYMSKEGFFSYILMPSGTLGISLAIFLPILIYFFFIHNSISSPIGRRAGWLVFSVVFLVLWLNRAERISSDMNWIYGIGAIIVLINLIFDERIHEYFGITQARAARRARIRLQIAELEERISRLRSLPNPSRIVEDTIRDLEHQLQRLHRRL
ncbi:MAG: hypothetical protein QW117_00125 [Candidatus Pacearchaeota archaeon]